MRNEIVVGCDLYWHMFEGGLCVCVRLRLENIMKDDIPRYKDRAEFLP